jgi:hypothetical protein
LTAETASRVASYVYGVARSDVTPSLRSGVAGADVRLVRHRRLAALVSDVPPAGVRARRRDLLAHSDVLQSAFAAGAVLPLRFGTVFDDDDSVAHDLLGDRHDALERLLKELDGAAELSVRATYVEEAVLGEIVRDDARVARLRAASRDVELGEAVAAALAVKRERDTSGIVAAVEPLVRDVVIEEIREPYEVVRASFLVDRQQLSSFDHAIEAVARDRAGVMVVRCVGPLPPHSFVHLEGY